jgi:Leucine-rich repeat (LRR) protein
VANVNDFLGVIVDLFPNVQHLTVDANATENVTLFLPMLAKQTSLTIKDVSLERICPSIREIGSRIRRINFSGKTSVLDVSMLADACPNLESLGISHSQLVVNPDLNNGRSRPTQKRFSVTR